MLTTPLGDIDMTLMEGMLLLLILSQIGKYIQSLVK